MVAIFASYLGNASKLMRLRRPVINKTQTIDPTITITNSATFTTPVNMNIDNNSKNTGNITINDSLSNTSPVSLFLR